MSAPAPPHYFEWEDAGGVAVVRFTTNMLREDHVIRALFDDLDQQLVGAGHNRIILNFTGLEGFASYAIGRLIALNDKLPAQGGRLVLCHLVPLVDELIDLMSLRKRFRIYATEREAIESFT